MSEKSIEAGKKNMRPLNTRTKEEQKKIATMGGIKSGMVRKERKLLSQIYAKVIDDESETIEAALKKKLQSGDLYYLAEMGKLTEGNKLTLANDEELPIQIIINPIESKNTNA